MTMDAMDNDDDEVDNIPNILPPRPPTPTEFTPDLTVDLPTPPMDVSEMKDIQFGTDPQPGTSQNTVSQIQKLQVLSSLDAQNKIPFREIELLYLWKKNFRAHFCFFEKVIILKMY